MKVKFLKSIGQWNAGETHVVSESDATWLILKKIAEPAPEEPSFEDLFTEAQMKEDPKPKARVKIQPSNKAQKAPENK